MRSQHAASDAKTERRAKQKDNGGAERRKQLVAGIAALAGSQARGNAKAEELESDACSCSDDSELPSHPRAASEVAELQQAGENPEDQDQDTQQPDSIAVEDADAALLLEELANDIELTEASVPAPLSAKEARRAHKKEVKAERRAQRSGAAEAVASKQKLCDECKKHVDLLIRCTTDETQEWRMLCGKCWKEASGGVPDGDDAHPYYRYGGLWKNRSAVMKTPGFSPMASQTASICAE